jgi:hemoglobin
MIAAMTTPYEALGGEPALRAIIRDFVERVTTDPMIGFFFARVDRARLEQMEFEHAAELLGATAIRYSGRPIRRVHAPYRISGGQFARRKEILRQVLVAHGVPEDIRRAWLAQVESLRSEVTADAGSECAGRSVEREG